ncbi:pentapeptide repeat-containing protein [Streptosporangium lutulentum]|uniref:Uncharacterized protein YjbI with pentapeptide repeats n=1 Tax=Streptosporangium lutulentum TaxID=1461250 RepID=A0ABT9QF20_9ACTN|nr:uncharacterized protein YjbI with pentapeptide repeats [Streptosporangium lutulentum]
MYLKGADLTGADLTGADLTGAESTGADLRGVKGMTADQIRKVAITDATTKFQNRPAGGRHATLDDAALHVLQELRSADLKPRLVQ